MAQIMLCEKDGTAAKCSKTNESELKQNLHNHMCTHLRESEQSLLCALRVAKDPKFLQANS